MSLPIQRECKMSESWQQLFSRKNINRIMRVNECLAPIYEEPQGTSSGVSRRYRQNRGDPTRIGRAVSEVFLHSKRDPLNVLIVYADNRATGVRGALRNRLRNGSTSALNPDRCRLMVASTRLPHMTHLRALIHNSPGAPLMSRQLSITMSPLHRVQFI